MSLERWEQFFNEPIERREAIHRMVQIGKPIILTSVTIDTLLSTPEAFHEFENGVEYTKGLRALYDITHTPEFHYDASTDISTIESVTNPRKVINLGNSFARGQVDFKRGDNANKQVKQYNISNDTNVFTDFLNPPGRLLVVRRNNHMSEFGVEDNWDEHNIAKNGGTIADVKSQMQVLKRNNILQTPIPKTLIIGAADNDAILTPEIQNNFASIENNVYQLESLLIAGMLEENINEAGDNFLQYLYQLDEDNQKEGYNVSDIWMLGSPYLTYSEGIVIKVSPTLYQVKSLASDGLARSLLDNVSDMINIKKHQVFEQYKQDNKKSSFNLHFLSARLDPRVDKKQVIPAQLYQHGTFDGYTRETARMAYRTVDQEGNNLGELYFPDYSFERNQRVS